MTDPLPVELKLAQMVKEEYCCVEPYITMLEAAEEIKRLREIIAGRDRADIELWHSYFAMMDHCKALLDQKDSAVADLRKRLGV